MSFVNMVDIMRSGSGLVRLINVLVVSIIMGEVDSIIVEIVLSIWLRSFGGVWLQMVVLRMGEIELVSSFMSVFNNISIGMSGNCESRSEFIVEL